MKNSLLCCTALLLFSTATLATPNVTGLTISWPDDGWYQVQDAVTYAEVCGGGRSCDAEPGTYVVINHTTGERFNNIEVVGDDGPTNGVTVAGNTISWPDDGWYQVQDQATYAEVCGGGRSCSVEPGTYVVINHSTGERFNNIEVVGDDGPANGVTVIGDTISWPDDGWYQVQDLENYSTVCSGVRMCQVPNGRYVVINHTTGQRFEPIIVSSGTTPDPVQASLELVADKTFRISWQLSTGAQFYRVLENPDGVSGFTQISTDLDASAQRLDHRVALYSRVNARYIVQACNAGGCVDSEEQIVSGTLERAIGYFKASNTHPGEFYDSGDSFGRTIGLSADGNTMAVGATAEGSASTGINGDQDDNSAKGAGAVYVFARVNGAWQQQAYLKASNTDQGDGFGGNVSLSADGNTMAVGARGEGSAATGINGDQDDNSAEHAGAVYVFARVNGAWQQQAYLKASNTDQIDGFGGAVSLSTDGNTLAVGATLEGSAATGINGDQDDNSAERAGAVYVFARVNGAWQQQAYLKASNTDQNDRFGGTVSLSADGNTLAVGSTGERSAATGINGDEDNNSAELAGAVYVFARVNGAWQQQAYLKASNTETFDNFGLTVSLSADGDTLAVGASHEDSVATGVNGNQDDDSTRNSGAVYVFARTNGIWQQQAYLKASNTDDFPDVGDFPDLSDFFGWSVSLSADGNTLAVGAIGESSASTGINGDQNNNGAYGSGAVYVFARTSGAWKQQAYLKASNTGTEPDSNDFPAPDGGDYFGGSVSLSADGNTLAVGAIAEWSAATGINGNQDDNSAPYSGAVYLY